MGKKKLGRGLDSVLSEIELDYENNLNYENAAVLELSLDVVKPNPHQPRKVFDKAALQELADSIKAHGLLQPVVVYENEKNEFVLIAGERRLRASKLAGVSSIKAIVADIDERNLAELALIENIQRENLNPIELAKSYKELIETHSITHEELSERIKKSRTQITNTLRLLQLEDFVQDLVQDGKISQGHAKILVGLSPKEQKLAADSIIGQKMSVRETENLVKNLKNGALDSQNNELDSENLGAKKGSVTKKHTLDRSLMQKLQKSLLKRGYKASISGDQMRIDFGKDSEISAFMRDFSLE